MKKVYILRHGTTVWNEKGITQGYFKNRLSKKGKEEIERTAEKYKDVKIDIIYSSPLVRTIQTANIINKYHRAKIVKIDDLLGIDQGIFAGRYWHKLTDEEKELHQKRDPSCRMESYQNIYKRSNRFVNEYLKDSKYKNILIVAHNANSTAIANILSNIDVDFDNKDMLNIFENGKIKEYNYE